MFRLMELSQENEAECRSIESKDEKYGPLEAAFWFAIAAHGAGLVTMALLLMPGMPGGLIPDSQRIAYIANNALVWRLGWLPWQLSADSDLAIALALLPMSRVPLFWKILVFAFTLAAIAPDQIGQFYWVCQGPELAARALSSNDPGIYLKFEAPIYEMVCAWAALLYTVLALAWTFAFIKAGLIGRALAKFSWLLWGLSFLCSLMFLGSKVVPIPFWLLAISNAVFFSGLMLWFAAVTENIIRKTRPEELWGRQAKWRPPSSITGSSLIALIGQSCFLRRIFEFVPPLPLASRIEQVIYINYLLPAELLEPLVPPHLELQRLGPEGNYALFTALSFRHHQFGPQLFGPLRKFMLTGFVSNWRIHVQDPVSKLSGIYFITNISDNLLMSLGARILSEAMPMHLAQSCMMQELSEGKFRLEIKPADGSAQDLQADLELVETAEPSKPADSSKPTDPAALAELSCPGFDGAWLECFETFADFLAYCVPQERAIASQPFLNRISYQEIRLGIPLSECKPLTGTISSQSISRLVLNTPPVIFLAPALEFRFNKEHYRKTTLLL